MNTFHDILTAASSLSPEERATLIAELWASVPPEVWPLPSDDWQREARRRSDEIDAGRMSTAPWSEARVRSRSKAGLDD